MKSGQLLRMVWAILLTSIGSQAQLSRQPNTTLHFPDVVGTSAGQYELVEFFSGMTFDKPVAITAAPGESNRVFVVERAGRIVVVNNLANPSKEVFLDISSRVHAADWNTSRRTEGLSSIAFHPNFAANGRFFLSYNTVTNGLHHNRVSEFRAMNNNTLGDASSEVYMIAQYDEGDGHNINDLHFGPDGFLYIASGDEGDGGTGDDFNNAQKIDKDFFSAIMRIDVDKRTSSIAPNPHPAANASTYKIPADNPYVGATSFNGIAVTPANVRTEFYAVGLRNPWRFSFDPLTQKIYEGDVGQHGREEINIIVKGGNYGWSFKEGTLSGPKTAPEGFVSELPFVQYGTGFGPMEGMSVTGGVVYRGDDAGMNGRLIFADYVSGNVWTVNVDSPNGVTRIGGETGIASFGYDPRNGDVLAVNHDQGKIKRLRYNSGMPNNVPLTLADAGIFSNLSALSVQPGIYSYNVNSPLWSDGANKLRWFSIPGTAQMEFSQEGNWTFPVGSVWVKHFEIQTTPGNANTTKRLETRVLVKTSSGAYGLTYKWNDQGTAASLVGEAGDTIPLSMNIGGQTVNRTWRIPSRADCMSCHTDAAGRVLGFTTPQLNRDQAYGRVSQNQIAALASAGFLKPSSLPAHFTNGLRTLASISDTNVSRTYRVRSYLAANCAQCHQPGTTTLAGWDARVSTPLSRASIVYGPVMNNAAPGEKITVPGNLNLSAMLKRMKSTGADRMPPLGVSVPDTNAIQLISDWIQFDLPEFESYDTWAARRIGNIPNSGARSDTDGDGILNYTEYLVNSDPLTRSSIASVTMGADGRASINFPQPANRGYIIETTDSMSSPVWTMLNNPLNQITFPAKPTRRTIIDPIGKGPGYYRFRVVEP